MAITDDLRKTFTDPTPLYFAAGTADLALQQARKVPELVEQLRAEAPTRIEAVRRTDPKAVQDKATARARELQATVQERVNGAIEQLEPDLRKLGETAQGLALRGVGVAFEYAVKARETYEKVAEHGEQTVRTWRGEEHTGAAPAAVTAPVAEPVVVETADESDLPGQADGEGGTTARSANGSSGSVAGSTAKASSAPKASSAAKRTTARKTSAKTTGTTGSAARRNGTKKTPPAK